MPELEFPSRCNPKRRQLLQMGLTTAGLTMLRPLAAAAMVAEDCSPPIPAGPFNGSVCPFPIPWLDKNGNHNQMPKSGVELSNIYHFKGRLARCAGFTGMGTDNRGNRLAFGTPTTDFSFMAGEYFAARESHQANFAHI